MSEGPMTRRPTGTSRTLALAGLGTAVVVGVLPPFPVGPPGLVAGMLLVFASLMVARTLRDPA
jgi:hypothetical protein